MIAPGEHARELRWLAIARIAFATLVLLRTTPLLAPFHVPYLKGTFPLLGWPGAAGALTGPLHPLIALPPLFVAALCVVRTAALVALLVGVRTRVAGVTAGLAGHLVLAQDEFGYLQTLNLLFLGCIVLGLTDCGARFALHPAPAREADSGAWLLRAFVASVYFWAGVTKLRADWLDGRAIGFFLEDGLLRGPVAGVVLATPAARRIVSVGVALFELLVGPALLWPRTRIAAVIFAAVFHVSVELCGGADFFGFGMLALLIAIAPAPRARMPLEASHRAVHP